MNCLSATGSLWVPIILTVFEYNTFSRVLDIKTRFWAELHGDRREGVVFCFYVFSLMRQRWRLLLTEAPLFGAQKRAARRAKGPLSYKVEGGGQQSLYSAVRTWPEQQLVIKLTSQQALALAPASHIIVAHWGGKSFFRGYQVTKQGWRRLIPAALALRDGESWRAAASVFRLKG